MSDVLRHAYQQAIDRQAKGIAEYDIHRAFVDKQGTELARLFPPDNPLDLKSLRHYLESSPTDEEEEDRSPQRFTIREIEENVKKRICGQDAAVDRVIP